MKSKVDSRHEFIDIAKTVLIVFVVLGHFLNLYVDKSQVFRSIYTFIYIFHMSCFFMISGFLFNDNQSFDKCLKKAMFYLVVYIALIVFSAFLKLLINGELGDLNVISTGRIPWFMLVMSIYSILGYFIKKEKYLNITILFMLISVLSGYLIFVGNTLSISRALYFFPFFLIGKGLKKSEISFSETYVFSFAIILILAVACLKIGDSIYSYKWLLLGNTHYPTTSLRFAICRILLYMISATVSVSFLSVCHYFTKYKKFFDFSKATLQIYCFHYYPVILIIEKLNIVKICEYGIFEELAYVLLAFIVTWILSLSIFGVWLDALKNYVMGNSHSYKGDSCLKLEK